jgi:hypothetical protein
MASASTAKAPETKAVECAAKSPNYIKWFVKFFSNEQGRDKFNKFVQYYARYMMARNLQADPKSEVGLKYKALFALFRDARKLDRLFKGAYEYDKLVDILKNPDPVQKYVGALGRVGFAAYWTFDNLAYLSTTKFVQPREEFAKYSFYGWWVGLACNLVLDSITLNKSFAEETKIKNERDAKNRAGTPDPPAAVRAKLDAIAAKRFDLYLNFPKNLGDLLVAGNGAKFHEKLLGYSFGDQTVGVAGMIPALIVMYQTGKATYC